MRADREKHQPGARTPGVPGLGLGSRVEGFRV